MNTGTDRLNVSRNNSFVDADADTDWKLFRIIFCSVFVLLCMWCSDYRDNTDAEFDGEFSKQDTDTDF